MSAKIIQNFGLFWERGQIEWGTPGAGNAGSLLGHRGDPNDSIDFRKQRGIYVLYEGDSISSQRVVYVGQAGASNKDLWNRLRDHRDHELWNRWQRFSWFGFLAVGKNGTLAHSKKTAVGKIDFPTALDQVESIVMALLEPLKNKQGPKWRGATEYFQTPKQS
jgi:hypothetical protein